MLVGRPWYYFYYFEKTSTYNLLLQGDHEQTSAIFFVMKMLVSVSVDREIE